MLTYLGDQIENVLCIFHFLPACNMFISSDVLQHHNNIKLNLLSSLISKAAVLRTIL